MLNQAQVERFAEDGCLVIPDVLNAADLAPVWAEYERLLDGVAGELHASGDLSSRFEDLPFDDRYTAMITECPAVFYHLGISLPLDYENLDPRWVRVHAGPGIFSLITNSKVLDVVESIIGGEITSNPVQQTRMKPPQRLLSGSLAEYSNVGATTWHQDFGAVMNEAAETDMLTVWIAITDASEEMGCLSVVPGSHRAEELTLHCPGHLNPAENYIPQVLLARNGTPPQPLPCRSGSLVLLSRWTEHGALANVSDSLRWSFDLRYQVSGQPTGRPAFPSFVARSRTDPDSVMTDPDEYAMMWEEARKRLLTRAVDGPVYEQGRWLANRDNPVCA